MNFAYRTARSDLHCTSEPKRKPRFQNFIVRLYKSDIFGIVLTGASRMAAPNYL